VELIEFVSDYKSRLVKMIEYIDGGTVSDIVTAFEKTLLHKSKIYVIGNGGSAATASHWVNDFAIGLKRRKINSYNMISLADNSAVCTAIANDIGYENIFLAQLQNILDPDDLILAISCSGNSPNIVNAVKYAREIGATVVGCTGFDGGQLYQLSDVKFHVPAPNGEYGLVEDIHMILDHIIYSYYVQKGL